MNNKNKGTVVIAAFTCCGKTTAAKNENCNHSMIDLDGKWGATKSSMARFICTDRIKDLRESLGHVDIILVHPSKLLFKDLEKNNIDYVLVYPEDTAECMTEWHRRNLARHTEKTWRAIQHGWHLTIRDFRHNKAAKAHYTLKPNEYLSDIIDRIYEEQAGSSEETKENNEK